MPLGKVVLVKPGTTLLAAARSAGIAISTRCGGNASCFMCKVMVDSDIGLSPIADKEERKLAGNTEKRLRLACQAKVISEALVHIPEDPLKAAVARQLAKLREESGEGFDD